LSYGLVRRIHPKKYTIRGEFIMKIDFHTHANLSKKIHISLEEFKEKVKEAKASGLTALAITEHFNSTNITELYDMFQENYPYEYKEAFIPVQDLIDVLNDFNVIKIGAHPLRKSTPWHHHELSVLTQFDAYDLNGKDLFTDGREMEKRVHMFANEYKIPVVGG